MAEKKSQAEILRDHINFQFDQNYNYSTKENRSLDVKQIQEKYKKLVVEDYNKLKSHHAKILQEVMKKRKIDPRTMGLSKKIPRFTPPTSLDAKITPKPQEVPTTTGTGAPIQTAGTPTATTTATIPYPVPTGHESFIKFNEKGVAATFNAFYLSLKIVFPEAENLDAEEKQSLGEMWTPIFNKYLSERMEIVMCFIATAGIFAPKLAVGRKKKKEKEPPKKSESKTEAPPKENETEQEKKDRIESEKIGKLSDEDQWKA